MISATIIADSISWQEVRLTTFSLVYPRFILSELNTHRMLSRNSASSRAIPTKKLLQEATEDMAAPVEWGKNQKGMQASEQLNELERIRAIQIWANAAIKATESARQMSELGVHKQVVNRIIEPFIHARTVLTGTEWNNFFKLRRHKDAQPEIKALAEAMWSAMQHSDPSYLKEGEWHLPYYRPENDEYEFALDHSVARCARASYNNHEGKETGRDEDCRLVKRLSESGHWSPFEHQATPLEDPNGRSNNFIGWKQYREICEYEPNWRLSTRYFKRQEG